mgnify:CR=1 FL=1
MRKQLKTLKNLWRYSDSQPTEITLAGAMATLVPMAVSMEIHCNWFLNAFFILAGLYQLRCIATCDIACRIRASFFTSSLYLTCLLVYLTTIGLPTPSHYGWILLTYSSFSTMNRLKTEQINRERNE